MSKPIKMTSEYLSQCREAFEEVLKKTKLSDGKITFTKTFEKNGQQATVFFTPEAWAKMVMLVKEFDKEIAWHGVASRLDEETHEYLITDIVVYPQTVTGASVEMDTEEYSVWLMKNADDERFDNLRMQGHSHVNMGVTPSAVDLNHQEEIVNMLGDEDFYIFMIWNKSFVSNCKIYDMKLNTLFENTDVKVKLAGSAEDLGAFLKQAKESVKSATYTPGKSTYVPPYNPSKSTSAAANTVSTSKSVAYGGKPKTTLGSGWYGYNAYGDDYGY